MSIVRKKPSQFFDQTGIFIEEDNLNETLVELAHKSIPLPKRKIAVADQINSKPIKSQKVFPSVDLEKIHIDKTLVNLIPVSIARLHNMVPVRLQKNKLFVAIDDPLNFIALDDARMVSGKEILPLLSTKESVESTINSLYGNENAEQAIEEFTRESILEDAIDANADPEISNAPIVKLVNSIIDQAVKAKASDIHIEPMEDEVRIRLRVDGQLYNALTVPKSAQPATITRSKIMGGMNIAEKRIPQDGRYHLKISEREIDIRMSTLPTVFGEKVVLRLLDRANFLISKEGLGFTKENIRKFDMLLNNPHGIVLVTGPTGSGKSTTLYAMLSELNKISHNIITVEDPVEYTMKGINQVQVNPKAGLTFATGLRSILRQDPDIVMIGEIRDEETVQIAIRTAITGHLVLSTLHTNDAPSSISRLIDMGVPPYMLAASLMGIISQRLVKKICPHCKRKYKPTAFDLASVGLPPDWNGETYKGTGCTYCNNTGYKGRIAVHEILIINKIVREMINNNASINDIRNHAITKDGMSTIKQECLKLMLKGETSIEEVIDLAFSQD